MSTRLGTGVKTFSLAPNQTKPASFAEQRRRNYILSRMTNEGKGFAETLVEAQKAGYE
jgi:hypothetical protein